MKYVVLMVFLNVVLISDIIVIKDIPWIILCHTDDITYTSECYKS